MSRTRFQIDDSVFAFLFGCKCCNTVDRWASCTVIEYGGYDNERGKYYVYKLIEDSTKKNMYSFSGEVHTMNIYEDIDSNIRKKPSSSIEHVLFLIDTPGEHDIDDIKQFMREKKLDIRMLSVKMACQAAKSGRDDVLSWLILDTLSLSDVAHLVDETGCGLLLLAIKYSQYDVVEWLEENCSGSLCGFLKQTDNKDQNVLHYTVQYSTVEFATRFLLEKFTPTFNGILRWNIRYFEPWNPFVISLDSSVHLRDMKNSSGRTARDVGRILQLQQKIEILDTFDFYSNVNDFCEDLNVRGDRMEDKTADNKISKSVIDDVLKKNSLEISRLKTLVSDNMMVLLLNISNGNLFRSGNLDLLKWLHYEWGLDLIEHEKWMREVYDGYETFSIEKAHKEVDTFKIKPSNEDMYLAFTLVVQDWDGKNSQSLSALLTSKFISTDMKFYFQRTYFVEEKCNKVPRHTRNISYFLFNISD